MVRFRIKIKENISLSTIQSGITTCPYCMNNIRQGSVAVCIYKITSGNPINIWIHISCFESVNQDIKKLIEKYGSEIMVKNL